MRKHILLIIVLIISCCSNIQAQVTIQANIGIQPVWGPVGYDRANYYYLPDIDAYYDVPHRQYIYSEHGRWVTRGNLPPRYANYDLYHGYKAVINEPSPWLHHDMYRSKYAEYRGHHDQQIIRDSHEDRYRANPNHPEHNQWQGNHGDRGHGDYGHDDHGHRNHGDQGHRDHGDQGHRDQNRGNQEHHEDGGEHGNR